MGTAIVARAVAAMVAAHRCSHPVSSVGHFIDSRGERHQRFQYVAGKSAKTVKRRFGVCCIGEVAGCSFTLNSQTYFSTGSQHSIEIFQAADALFLNCICLLGASRALSAGSIACRQGQNPGNPGLLNPNFLPFWQEFFTAETQSTQRLKTQQPRISRMGSSGHGLLLSRRDGAARRSSGLESRKQAPPMRSDQRSHPSTGVCFRDSSPDDSQSPCPRRQSYFLCDLCVSAVCFLLGCGR